MIIKCFIGWDSREQEAYNVAQHSMLKHASCPIEIIPIRQSELREKGLYTRNINEPCSVEFTYTRFLVPFLCEYKGWAYFCDCDFLFTKDIAEVFALGKSDNAAYVVKHDYVPRTTSKMDGQKQVAYPRKNWSSSVLWNCEHPANKAVTLDFVNNVHPSVLHRFNWLADHQIGELPLEYNWLEGEYDKPETPPAIIHFTNGGPWFENYQDVDYADLWLCELKETQA